MDALRYAVLILMSGLAGTAQAAATLRLVAPVSGAPDAVLAPAQSLIPVEAVMRAPDGLIANQILANGAGGLSAGMIDASEAASARGGNVGADLQSLDRIFGERQRDGGWSFQPRAVRSGVTSSRSGGAGAGNGANGAGSGNKGDGRGKKARPNTALKDLRQALEARKIFVLVSLNRGILFINVEDKPKFMKRTKGIFLEKSNGDLLYHGVPVDIVTEGTFPRRWATSQSGAEPFAQESLPKSSSLRRLAEKTNLEWEEANVMNEGGVGLSAGRFKFDGATPSPERLKATAVALLKQEIGKSGGRVLGGAIKASVISKIDAAVRRAAKDIAGGFDYSPENSSDREALYRSIATLVLHVGKPEDLVAVSAAATVSADETGEGLRAGLMLFLDEKTGEYEAFYSRAAPGQ